MLKLRDAIRSAVPEAVESFGYGMPAFALDGKNFVWYGAWKNHISFYPISDATRRALADEVVGYNTSSKGTSRFRSDEDLPTSLVVRLVRGANHRAAEASKDFAMTSRAVMSAVQRLETQARRITKQ
jgi:uncharacterized protein YdhG (YjbR/CyaY superfamily)